MTHEEMVALWSAHFQSPFPESAYKFWRKYDVNIIDAGFRALAKKSTTFQFKTLVDACRFATGVMRCEWDNQENGAMPAPVPTTSVGQKVYKVYKDDRLIGSLIRDPDTKSRFVPLSEAVDAN